MKVTVLIENTSINQDLIHEHGLSLLIEANGKNILFDTGQSGKFGDNAKNLEIDLNTVDLAVLSHGHYDHGGGLNAFTAINKHAPIYLNSHALESHYHHKKYIGLDSNSLDLTRLKFIDSDFQLDNSIELLNFDSKLSSFPTNSKNFYVKNNNKLSEENFNHEHYLKITENGKSILFSGCSHKGILNIVDYFKPDVLIGGFHLMDVKLDENSQKQLDNLAEILNSYDCIYYTCHCTGKEQYKFLKEKLGDKLQYLSTGTVIDI